MVGLAESWGQFLAHPNPEFLLLTSHRQLWPLWGWQLRAGSHPHVPLGLSVWLLAAGGFSCRSSSPALQSQMALDHRAGPCAALCCQPALPGSDPGHRSLGSSFQHHLSASASSPWKKLWRCLSALISWPLNPAPALQAPAGAGVVAGESWCFALSSPLTFCWDFLLSTAAAHGRTNLAPSPGKSVSSPCSLQPGSAPQILSRECLRGISSSPGAELGVWRHWESQAGLHQGWGCQPQLRDPLTPTSPSLVILDPGTHQEGLIP